jgi:hypothetical protein
MQITPPGTAPLQNFGSLREHAGGAPAHSSFVVARTTPNDGSTPLELSTKGGTRLWQSFDEDPASVLADAQAAARAVGQAVAVVTAEPGHWQQFFVMPLFRTDASGVQQAITGLAQLGTGPLAHSHHLVGLADATSALDVRAMPVDAELMPPRARPGAF